MIDVESVPQGSRTDPVAGGAYAETLERFEEQLGDPRRAGPLSYAAAAERDRNETYPQDAIDLLAQLGAQHLQIPAAQGGALRSLDQLVAGSYAVGRRDAAVSLSGGLQMWSQLVWMAGSDEQRRVLQALLDGNAGVCLAASEGEHGADLLSTACRAEPAGDGYVLRGEKWPIGCARECRVALVLARTRPERGPRSLSWFFLGPESLDHHACRRLPKVPTAGMRASDVSGLAFDGLPLGRESLIGPEGAGLELSLKLFQLTRPLVASLALGPGDTALRMATEFALDRRLYGKAAADLPTVRRALVRAWVDFLIAETVGMTTARGAHVDPEGLSAGSLVAKIVVPSFVHTSVDLSARVLGARAFMRDYAHGTFEKMSRDQRVVSVLDGSTEVCLQALASQMPTLLSRPRDGNAAALAIQCTAHEPVPPLAYDRLEVAPRQGGLVVFGLDDLMPTVVRHDAPADPAARAVSQRVTDDRARLAARAADAMSHGRWGASRTAAMADVASDYAALHALAACAAFSVCNRGAGLVTERASWLWMAARRLCISPPEGAPAEHELVDDLFADLRVRVEQRKLLSALHASGACHG